MMRALTEPTDAVRDTPYARAVDQAVYFAELGMTPKQAIDAAGFDNWNPKQPTWDDAIFALAYVYRRKCRAQIDIDDDLPQRAFEGVPAEDLPKMWWEKKKTRSRCLKCDETFESEGAGNRICPKCGRANGKMNTAMVEGVAA